MCFRDEMLANCRLAQQVLYDCTAIDDEIAELQREIEVVAELIRKSIYENAHVAVNQDEFNERHSGYMERHQNAAERIASLETQRRERQNKLIILNKYIKEIESRPLVIEEFDDKLWIAVVEKVIVLVDDRLDFYFKDGTCVKG